MTLVKRITITAIKQQIGVKLPRVDNCDVVKNVSPIDELRLD
jgi:hypothetical protein